MLVAQYTREATGRITPASSRRPSAAADTDVGRPKEQTDYTARGPYADVRSRGSRLSVRCRPELRASDVDENTGASLERVSPGEVEVRLPFRNDLTQHHGFMAAAILTAVVDVACGYAAMSLMPSGSSVLTSEYKADFLAPAQSERMLARGRVIRPGRTVTVCAGDVVAVDRGQEKLVATLLATMMRVGGERPTAPPTSSAQVHHRFVAHSRGIRRWPS
ncbi:MAG: PaaI family thioesterase, partial [bacterium]